MLKHLLLFYQLYYVRKKFFLSVFLNHKQKHSCSVRNINNSIIYFYVLLVTVDNSEKGSHFETPFSNIYITMFM